MNEIPTSTFATIARDCLCRKARMADRIITRAYDEALRPSGLKITQFTLLVAIGYGEPGSISELADWLAMERTTLTRNLKLLEKEELIVAGTGSHHKSRVFKLTGTGQQKVKQAYPLWREAQARYREKLCEDGWNNSHAILSLFMEPEHAVTR
ncbi:MarR family winged helix-turn-helix transcriptional regulator [Gynuella sunshinyii]|uniref:Transcriptional regulator n=1 Tax=Gynuella sunshinyii YC6258 TaxID=1445510 RepID=A0A0C5VRC6_9GAMM|nr:MarR family winged helix-turn-helix transcriptional regulator [Gynuella sunshinyii]AJQ96791.1 transcriptional regulator [Gynuella sunshinyii YC6258]